LSDGRALVVERIATRSDGKSTTVWFVGLGYVEFAKDAWFNVVA
jgi:hypothetical protein